MDKVLKIEDVEKEIVVKGCYDCPMSSSGAICDRNWIDCPLPDAAVKPKDEWPNDENHRLGPNGERLIAKRQYDTCYGCFYHCGECKGVECYEKIWVLAGDRK